MFSNCQIFITAIAFVQVSAFDINVNLSQDGPAVIGSNITFKAVLLDSEGNSPVGKFQFEWRDDAIEGRHHFESIATSNTTNYYSVNYPAKTYPIGLYTMEVIVYEYRLFIFRTEISSRRIEFRLSRDLHGGMVIEQMNKTVPSTLVASGVKSELSLNLRKADLDYINSTSTSILTYWFIDCKFYNATKDFKLPFIFNGTNYSHTIEALVIASYEQPITTTPLPATTSTIKPSTTSPTTSATTATSTAPNTTISWSTTSGYSPNADNISTIDNTTFPYICKNKRVRTDQNKTYGYFYREVKVRDPIMNLNINGTNWIQPWEMLYLSVSCNGSGPFHKCYQLEIGSYNVTGNETCKDSEEIPKCEFHIKHWFLDPIDYTVLIIVSNEVSSHVSPVKINFYKVTPKPQLSVIVVPITCSLIAFVIIAFGIAYYFQNRSRITVEVADFDFGQINAEMEYKTFRERLHDSFNNAGYRHLRNTKDESTHSQSE